MRMKTLRLDAFREELPLTKGKPPAFQKKEQTALQVLKTAIKLELTPRQRQCVELCLLEGKTQEEAGKILGVGKSTVCRHMQKAVKALRRTSTYLALSGCLPCGEEGKLV